MDYAEGMRILRELGIFAPAIVSYQDGWHVFSRTALQSSGPTIEAALQAGGFVLRSEWRFRPVYIAVGCNIVQGAATLATARSNRIAQRIANALNEYIPGDRGF